MKKDMFKAIVNAHRAALRKAGLLSLHEKLMDDLRLAEETEEIAYIGGLSHAIHEIELFAINGKVVL